MDNISKEGKEILLLVAEAILSCSKEQLSALITGGVLRGPPTIDRLMTNLSRGNRDLRRRYFGLKSSLNEWEKSWITGTNIIRVYQRAHEPLEETIERLARKYSSIEFASAFLSVLGSTPEVVASGRRRVRGEFTVPEGWISMQQAARENDVPNDFLWRLAKEDLITVLHKGTGRGDPTYLDKEEIPQVARLYHKAKEEDRIPIRVIRREFKKKEQG